MELKDKVKMLGLSGKDAPEGITENHFAKLLSAVRTGRPISKLGTELISMICDAEVLLRLAKGGKMGFEPGYVKLFGLINFVKGYKEGPDGNEMPSGDTEQALIERQQIEPMNGVAKKQPPKDGYFAAVEVPVRFYGDSVMCDAGNSWYYEYGGKGWKVPKDRPMKGKYLFGGELVDTSTFKSK